MLHAIVVAEVLMGLAYTGLGVLTVYEMRAHRSTRGRSQFGLAFAGMAFTCGPHHLLHAALMVQQGHGASGAMLVAFLIGLPPGLVFVGLRVEALRGGAGDRQLIAGAVLVPGAATAIAMIAGAIVMSGLSSPSLALDSPFTIANLVLVASYLAVGWYILTTQLRRYTIRGSWSLSGVALGFIFPTCGLVHLTHIFATRHHELSTTGLARALVVLDVVGLPASIWFLAVVRRLHHEALADWNRRPLVGERLEPRRTAPWEHEVAVGR